MLSFKISSNTCANVSKESEKSDGMLLNNFTFALVSIVMQIFSQVFCYTWLLRVLKLDRYHSLSAFIY